MGSSSGHGQLSVRWLEGDWGTIVPLATQIPIPMSLYYYSFIDTLQKLIIHTNEKAPNRQGDGYNPLLPPVKCTSKVNKEPPCCLLKGCARMCMTVLRFTSSIALSIYSCKDK